MAQNSKTVSFLRGRTMRATRVSAVGAPIVGDESQAVSKGFISVAYTSNIETGTDVTLENARGETCISERGLPSFTGVGIEITFCEVDPSVFSLVTGQDVILDPETGDAIGFVMEEGVDLTANAFALELWMGTSTNATPHANSEGFYGYVLTPFLAGGVVGDFTIENGAITFTVTGLNSKKNSQWGAGPYDVQLGATGARARLSKPVGANEHFRTQIVEVAPPEPFVGLRPVLDPASPALTGITATVTGLSVAFAPEPAGTAPMWYDFGDGTWDYDPDGSITHVYAAAGTYTVVAYRGRSSVTEDVTVSA